VLEGLGVAPGIAIGPVHRVEPGMPEVREYAVPPEAIEAECARFERAAAAARAELEQVRHSAAAALSGAAAEELGYMLDASLRMLTGSRLLRGVLARLRARGINAEAAVQGEVRRITDDFRRIGDPYIAARVQDIRDAGNRLLHSLAGIGADAPPPELPDGAIVLAEELSPAETATLAPRRVGGFATEQGGAEGHTAILARSLGLPAVLGVAGLVQLARPGDLAIVDGERGRVVLNPAPATLERYRGRLADLGQERRLLARLRSLKAESRDGVEVKLQVNVDLPGELEAVHEVGAAGIGLFRSEFMFMNRTDLPVEDEQYAILRQVVEGMRGAPVTVRTLDLGGEKLAPSLGAHFADSPNPALGLRAIRLSLSQPKLLNTQLAAILRAARHGTVRILLPMVTGSAEVKKVRDRLRRLARRLHQDGVAMPDPLPPLGVMIETPAAALAADDLAYVADFFSIGTNDLTMYTLAIDRADEQVAHLYDPLHPAVLRLIQFATAAAQARGLPVNLCGEIAGDPRYTALLLGLGLRDLSMAARSLPRVKRRIRELDVGEAERRAMQVMRQHDPARIAALIDDFNGLAAV